MRWWQDIAFLSSHWQLQHSQVTQGSTKTKSRTHVHLCIQKDQKDTNSSTRLVMLKGKFLSSPPLTQFFAATYLSTPGTDTWLNLPDAVPQQGGTHQAEEKMLVITSGGKRVTFLWIWSKFNTNARNTPMKNSTTPRITKFMPRLVTDEMYGPHFFGKVGIASFSAMTS